uniref:Uncharacterized protein n=1 Tax=Solanum lycopersicum TaxID=4081 RepID=A0A3Q7G468_SOLLC
MFSFGSRYYCSRVVILTTTIKHQHLCGSAALQSMVAGGVAVVQVCSICKAWMLVATAGGGWKLCNIVSRPYKPPEFEIMFGERVSKLVETGTRESIAIF